MTTRSTAIMPVVGLFFALLGVIGLAVPILPGVLFLLIAALCFSSGAPGLRRKIRNSRFLRSLNDRVESRSAGLNGRERVQLRRLMLAQSVLSPFTQER
mgnify:CR=1 FL=1